jgi:hypothetical protein
VNPLFIFILFYFIEGKNNNLNNLFLTYDGVNYISCSLTNLEEKISYILNPDNLEKINEIRKNGYEFVWKYHKQTDRIKYIDNFVNNKLLN